MLLKEVLPQFAVELERLLRKQGEVELASQASLLMIVDRCRCGDDFCASFYTQPKPKGAYRPGHRSMELEPAEGMLILDLVGGRIAHVEVVNRNDIREKLLAALP
jgi:hypothetical protein